MGEDAKSKYSLVNDDLNSLTTTVTTTTETPITTSNSSSNITEAVTESNVLLPFAPTVLPKGSSSRYSVDTSSIFKRHKKKISFLEKLKNTARNPYKKADHLQDTISITSSSTKNNKLK